MPEHSEPQAAGQPLALKDPVIAGFLAWLVPGLGHLYQGRRAKAALYCASILGIFLFGAYLGSSSQTGWARVVYISSRPNDLRLPFLCQMGVGLPVIPAVLQANRFYNRREPYWNGFMASPKLEPNDPGEQSLNDLQRKLARSFELGTVYTMIAGLLNVLAIYDACCGPVVMAPAKKKRTGPPTKDEKKEKEAA